MSVAPSSSSSSLSAGTAIAVRPSGDLHFVRVFAAASGGGNPAPVVLDADNLSADEMKAVAERYGHESVFVCAARDVSHMYRLRFFVPHHEMEMCGHATLGALWLLRQLGRWTSGSASLETLSGIVEVRVDERTQAIAVSQPEGVVTSIEDERLHTEICRVLQIDPGDLDSIGIVNATTSRTKTLIPFRSVERLNATKPLFAEVRDLCDELGSTGLYPFAVDRMNPLAVHARQFPRSSGYAEDAATGIAAAATFYGALRYGLLGQAESGMTVYQGYAMGKPSSIRVELRNPNDLAAGCWISGAVESMILEPLQ
jgi:trans-2,3-dihydro-3-hydroxyanthranilate isomerase